MQNMFRVKKIGMKKIPKKFMYTTTLQVSQKKSLAEYAEQKVMLVMFHMDH